MLDKPNGSGRFPKTQLLKKTILVICFVIIVAWIIVALTISLNYKYHVWDGSYSAFNIFTVTAIACCTISYGVYRVSPRARSKVAAIKEMIPSKWKTLINSGVTPYFNPEHYQIIDGRWQRVIDVKLDLDDVGLPVVANNVPLATFNVDIYKQYYRNIDKQLDSIKANAIQVLPDQSGEIIEYFYDTIRENLRIQVMGETCWLVKPQYHNTLLIHKDDYVPFIINDILDNNNALLTDQLNDEIMYEINKVTGLDWLVSVLFEPNIPPKEKQIPNRHIYTPIYRELCAICNLSQTPSGKDLTTRQLVGAAFKALCAFIVDPKNPISYSYLRTRYLQAVIRISVVKNLINMVKSMLHMIESNSRVLPEMIYTRLTMPTSPDAVLTFTDALNSVKADPTFLRIASSVETIDTKLAESTIPEVFVKRMETPLPHVATRLSMRFANISQLISYIDDDDVLKAINKNNRITSQIMTNAINNNLFATMDKSKVLPELLEVATVASRNNLALLNRRSKPVPIILIDKNNPNGAIRDLQTHIKALDAQLENSTLPENEKEEIQRVKKSFVEQEQKLKQARNAADDVRALSIKRLACLKHLNILESLKAKINQNTRTYASVKNTIETKNKQVDKLGETQTEVVNTVPKEFKEIVWLESDPATAEDDVDSNAETEREEDSDDDTEEENRNVKPETVVAEKPVEITQITNDLKDNGSQAIAKLENEAVAVKKSERFPTSNITAGPTNEDIPISLQGIADNNIIKDLQSRYQVVKSKSTVIIDKVKQLNSDEFTKHLSTLHELFSSGDKVAKQLKHGADDSISADQVGINIINGASAAALPMDTSTIELNCKRLDIIMTDVIKECDLLQQSLNEARNRISASQFMQSKRIADSQKLQNANPEIYAISMANATNQCAKEDELCQTRSLLLQAQDNKDLLESEMNVLRKQLKREQIEYEEQKQKLAVQLQDLESQSKSKIQDLRIERIKATAAVMFSEILYQSRQAKSEVLENQIEALTAKHDYLTHKNKDAIAESYQIEANIETLNNIMNTALATMNNLNNRETLLLQQQQQFKEEEANTRSNIMYVEKQNLDDEYDKIISDLKSQLIESSSEIAILTEKLKDSQTTKADIQAQMDELTKILKSKEDDKNINESYAQSQLRTLRESMELSLQKRQYLLQNQQAPMQQPFMNQLLPYQQMQQPFINQQVAMYRNVLLDNYDTTKDQLISKTNVIRDEIEKIKSVLQEADVHLSYEQSVIEDTSRQLHSANAQVAELNNVLEIKSKLYQEELQNLTQEVISMQTSTSATTAIQIQQLQKNVDEVQVERAMVTDQLNTATKQISELEKERALMSSNIATLQQSLDANKSELKVAITQSEKLKEYIKVLKEERDESQTQAQAANISKEIIAAELQSLQAQAREQEKQIQNYKQQISEYGTTIKASDEKIASGKQLVASLEATINGQNEQIHALTNRSIELTNGQIDNLKELVLKRDTTIDALNEEKEALQNFIITKEQKLESVQQTKDSMQEVIAQRDKLIRELGVSNDDLLDKNKKQDSTINEQRQRLTSQQETLGVRDSTIENQDRTINKYKTEIEQYKGEILNYKNKISNSKPKEEYGKLNTRIQSLRADLLTKDNEISKQFNKIKLHEKEIESLQLDIADLEKKTKEQDNEIVSLKNELMVTKQQVRTLEATITSLNSELENQLQIMESEQ